MPIKKNSVKTVIPLVTSWLRAVLSVVKKDKVKSEFSCLNRYAPHTEIEEIPSAIPKNLVVVINDAEIPWL